MPISSPSPPTPFSQTRTVSFSRVGNIQGTESTSRIRPIADVSALCHWYQRRAMNGSLALRPARVSSTANSLPLDRHTQEHMHGCRDVVARSQPCEPLGWSETWRRGAVGPNANWCRKRHGARQCPAAARDGRETSSLSCWFLVDGADCRQIPFTWFLVPRRRFGSSSIINQFEKTRESHHPTGMTGWGPSGKQTS